MNKQRKVLITITYNEMGIIIDTKAEEVAQPELAQDLHSACADAISRQAAIDAILAVTGNSSVRELYEHVQEHGLSDMWSGGVNAAIDIIIAVPSAQPEIIRCKDCKWKQGLECVRFAEIKPFPDDFCSRVERREE